MPTPIREMGSFFGRSKNFEGLTGNGFLFLIRDATQDSHQKKPRLKNKNWLLDRFQTAELSLGRVWGSILVVSFDLKSILHFDK